MQVAATLRYARISPQKCRLMADVIRGKSVDEALRTLTFSPKKSARIVKKVLESAIALVEMLDTTFPIGIEPAQLKLAVQSALRISRGWDGIEIGWK